MSNLPQIHIDHHVAQLWGVDKNLLNDKKLLLQATNRLAEELELTVVNSFIHKFEPHGLSLVLVIAQSHLAIHTWPEFGYMHLDLVSCAESTQLDRLEDILKKEFVPQTIDCRKIEY